MPLTAIERFSSVRSGKIEADFYNDCKGIPDPSALDPIQESIAVGRLLPRQAEQAEAYCTRGRHKTISDYLHIQFEKIQTLLSCSHKT